MTYNSTQTNIIPMFLIVLLLATLLLFAMSQGLWSGDYYTTVTMPAVNEYTFSLSKEYLDLVDAMQNGLVEDYEAAAGQRGVLHDQLADALGVEHEALTTEDVEAIYLEGRSAGYEGE